MQVWMQQDDGMYLNTSAMVEEEEEEEEGRVSHSPWRGRGLWGRGRGSRPPLGPCLQPGRCCTPGHTLPLPWEPLGHPGGGGGGGEVVR